MADEFENEQIEVGLPEAEGVEIEIIDDTPEQDKGRKPLATKVDDVQEEELENYSEKVNKRISQLNHKYHDERREKERLAREHSEAIRIAQAIHEENEKLKQTLEWGRGEYAKEAVGHLDAAQLVAQDRYRKAFESGDTDGVIAAQTELNELAIRRHSLEQFKAPKAEPQENYQKPLQQQNNAVYNPQQNTAPEIPRDYKAEDWASRNPWFGQDEEMTAFAYGLHEKLVKNGVDPTSDEYYQKVDSRLREVFPNSFSRPKKSSPVASVGRTTAPKKVTLTATQVAIAKRLGVPLEVYAKHAAKEAQING